MKLLHTADIRLDSCYASTGLLSRYANRRRQSLREVFADLIRRAAEWPADAVVIAGDLFDGDFVTRDTLAFVRSKLASIGTIPVFIAPGERDPATSDSSYCQGTWPENVFIFRKPSWAAAVVQGGRLVVHGFGHDAKKMTSNPWDGLVVERDGALHIGVGHGAERSHLQAGDVGCCPFDARVVDQPGLAYLALGHLHEAVQVEGTRYTAMQYAGAPEGHGFAEPGIHHYVEAEVDDRGVRVTCVPSSRLVFATYALDCTAIQRAQQVVDAISGFAGELDAPQAAQVVLTGRWPRTLAAEIQAVYDAVSMDFEVLDIVDQTEPPERYEDLARQSTTLGLFMRRLNEAVADVGNEAEQAVLLRAREVGLGAYRGWKLPIRGLSAPGGDEV